jgi:uncharacterized protein YcaQ
LRRLTRDQARRVAIAAQGLAAPRPSGAPNIGHVTRAIRATGLLQIDSVNVVERAHHLTLFSRLGPYDTNLLWRALEERRLFEYWARMASFCPIEDFPLFRHRMERHARRDWKRIVEMGDHASEYVEAVYRQVAERGPLAVADLDEPGERRGPWWGWADGKVALEYLFSAGRVGVAFRRNFTRYYDIVERVIPARYLQGESPDAADAQRLLILQAGKALGVGTARDLIDYYWIRVDEGRPALADLVADGALLEVEVEGWETPSYMHPEASVPRSIEARTLVNPFDTLMWNRDRIQRLHDFLYRIEIYVPQPKRVHGYYVFPFLLGDDLVARVDLKADRKAGALQVHGAFLETGAPDATHVAAELAVELAEMARWLGLGEIAVGAKGDLSGPLRTLV